MPATSASTAFVVGIDRHGPAPRAGAIEGRERPDAPSDPDDLLLVETDQRSVDRERDGPVDPARLSRVWLADLAERLPRHDPERPEFGRERGREPVHAPLADAHRSGAPRSSASAPLPGPGSRRSGRPARGRGRSRGARRARPGPWPARPRRGRPRGRRRAARSGTPAASSCTRRRASRYRPRRARRASPRPPREGRRGRPRPRGRGSSGRRGSRHRASKSGHPRSTRRAG